MDGQDNIPLIETPSSNNPSQQELWSCLTTDPTSGILLMSRDLCVLYANEVLAQMLFGEQTGAADIVGRHAKELYSPNVYAEHVQMADAVAEMCKPLLSRTIWNGQQMVSWMYPIVTGEDEDADEVVDRFLAVIRPSTKDFDTLSESTPDIQTYQNQYVDLGEASQLTHTELVVLALVGQSMTIAEIAKHLHRSTKTIESHRLAIGRKLNLDNRAKLVQFVEQLGLKISDVDRTDVKRTNQPYYKRSSQ